MFFCSLESNFSLKSASLGFIQIILLKQKNILFKLIQKKNKKNGKSCESCKLKCSLKFLKNFSNLTVQYYHKLKLIFIQLFLYVYHHLKISLHVCRAHLSNVWQPITICDYYNSFFKPTPRYYVTLRKKQLLAVITVDVFSCRVCVKIKYCSSQLALQLISVCIRCCSPFKQQCNGVKLLMQCHASYYQ